MTGVLHPVGPEPEQTYWRRRALVVGAALALVILLISLLVNATNSGSAVAAAPPPAPVPAPVEAPATLSASPTPSAASAASPSPSATSGRGPDAAARAGGRPTAEASQSATASPPAKRKASGPVVCSPGDLRTTLTGKQSLKPKQRTAFKLSLINGSSAPCLVKVTSATFELKIYSGTDRIWSSDDCARTVKPISTKVAAEDAVEWSMAWDGRRSKDDCKRRPEVPKAGTYIATAQLDGARPVQLRLILRG